LLAAIVTTSACGGTVQLGEAALDPIDGGPASPSGAASVGDDRPDGGLAVEGGLPDAEVAAPVATGRFVRVLPRITASDFVGVEVSYTSTAYLATSREVFAMKADELLSGQARPVFRTGEREVISKLFAPADDAIFVVTTDSVIRLFDGKSLRSLVQLPNKSQVHAIWGASRDDVWFAHDRGALLHLANGKLTDVAQPRAGEGHVRAIAGTSATDVWAVGDHEILLHWDGERWTSKELPRFEGEPTARRQFHGVFAFGRDDIAVSLSYEGDGTRTLVARWDGRTWTPDRIGVCATQDDHLNADIRRASPFSGVEPGRALVGWQQTYATGHTTSRIRTLIARFPAHGCSVAVRGSPDSAPRAPWAVNRFDIDRRFRAFAAHETVGLVGVGVAGAIAKIEHNSTYEQVRPVEPDASTDSWSVRRLSTGVDGETWGFGSDRVSATPSLRRWTGTSWGRGRFFESNPAHALAVQSANDVSVLASERHGGPLEDARTSIDHFDGSRWTTVARFAERSYIRVSWSHADGTVWFVGGVEWHAGPSDVRRSGTVAYVRENGQWIRRDLGIDIHSPAIAIAGFGPNDVYLLVQSSKRNHAALLRWDGAKLTGIWEREHRGSWSMATGPGDELWVAGPGIERLRQGVWSTIAPDTRELGFSNGVTGVYARNERDVWFAGAAGDDGGLLLHWDGVRITRALETEVALTDLVGRGDHATAVGPYTTYRFVLDQPAAPR
jgi:hypothetical protein